MMYIFPRQFGLHNVFTAEVDPKETVQPFKDYILREDEIHAKFPLGGVIKIPKRLRGKASALVQKLQVQHSRCLYKGLLKYYCPVRPTLLPLSTILTCQAIHETSSKLVANAQLQQSNGSTSTMFKTQKSIPTNSNTQLMSTSSKAEPRKPSMMDHATPTAMVSAFCRAVLCRLIPHEFWGVGEVRLHNEAVFYYNVERFIGLRRFETLSLHEVSQFIKVRLIVMCLVKPTATKLFQITNIDWLGPPTAQQRLSQSDLNKRIEIFHEFLYYIFDSILIPLIRANFYVTESNIHRYRLFFFRHDVWRSLAEPAVASLKLTMFEEIKLDRAQKILDSRNLGFSQVRLLPKQTGVRPIMNLRRRMIKRGSNVLSSSINSVLAPVYNALTFEKVGLSS